MEHIYTKEEILAHYIAPAFCVEDGIITQVNPAAANQLVCQGAAVESMFVSGQEEYSQFSGGCLYVALELGGKVYSTAITREKDFDLFVAEQSPEDEALQAYALAAKELREPLAGIMVAADRLFRNIDDTADPVSQRQAAFINQNLYKMLRILGNMSDASRYAGGSDVTISYCNVTSMLSELFQEISDICEKSGIQFRYTCPDRDINAPVDQAKLERGIYNLISNAIKFTEKGGSVQVQAVKRSNRLYITITDSGSGIPRSFQSTIYRRYQRSAGIEESRQGIGLGMVLAKSVASIHGGAILMEPQAKNGAKITMTISLEPRDLVLRSPVMRIDYVGERSHSLVELADSLDAQLYCVENLK